MATIGDVTAVMENWAPSQIAESWDNPGLAVGDPCKKVDTLILTLDITEQTLKLASKKRASLVISHHPPIFKPLSSLSGSSLPVRIITQAIKDDIALFSAHTNLDQAPGGVSMTLAETLGLSDITPLSPGNCDLVKLVTFVPPEHTDRVREAAGAAGAGKIGEYTFCSFSALGKGTFIPGENASPYSGKVGILSDVAEDRLEMIVPLPLINDVLDAAREAHPYEEMAYDIYPMRMKEPAFGYGAVGNLKTPLDAASFTMMVQDALMIESPRISPGTGSLIKRVALMGGSGSDFIEKALNAGADAFVTGEIGHHDYIEHGEAIMLLDATHRGTELPVLDTIKRHLNENETTKNLEVIIDNGTKPFSHATHIEE